MTQNVNNITGKALVAIDISKAKHDVLIELACGKRKKMIIKNNMKDYQVLLKTLEPWKNHCLIAFEPTGNYHRTLAYFLVKQGLELAIVSSLAGARVREAIFNSWDKNDPKDCHVILHLVKSGLYQIYYDPLINNIHNVQELSKTYHYASLSKTRLQHSILTHYLPLYFPEIQKYYHSSRAKWFAKVFKVFTVPQAITQYSMDDFKQKAWDLVGRKVAKDNWLTDLYFTAQTSVALPINEKELGVQTFRMILAQYEQLISFREEIEKMAVIQLDNNCLDYKILTSIPGIGPILAMMIIAEAGDLRRFKHYKQFLKFCGFDLATYQSGKTKGTTVLSKRGNARLRYAFWLGATVAIRMTENTFREKYENYIKKAPDDADLKRKAYTAVAVKMARVAHSLIKQGTSYRCYHSDAQWIDPALVAVEAHATS